MLLQFMQVGRKASGGAFGLLTSSNSEGIWNAILVSQRLIVRRSGPIGKFSKRGKLILHSSNERGNEFEDVLWEILL